MQEKQKKREKNEKEPNSMLLNQLDKTTTGADIPLQVLSEDGLGLPQSGLRVNIHLPLWKSS